MTQSPTRLSPFSVVTWCAAAALATAGCARHRPALATPAAPDSTARPADPATLRVTNSNWSDVRIYLVRGAMWVRLGTVTTNRTGDFTMPQEFVSYAGSVTLVANPVAGWGSWTTTLPVIQPGDELELVVENILQYSHLVVR
jgi:hypothetical protein